ncbi:MAG TPA: carboxypeptidase-like regulatory domain-containing protein [Gemmatimonadaceae bacterium]
MSAYRSRSILRSLIASLALVGAATQLARAQTIRGTVLDETSKLPVASVLLTLVDELGTEILPGVRSDSLGAFMLHAARAGTWRVKAMRIGYAPVGSEPVALAVGGLAVMRLRMTTVAQRMIPVQIVEQRMLSASELMSTTGFDLRASRGSGKFLSGERLAAMGRDGVREILATFFQPTLIVFNDPVVGDVLRIQQGASQCAPEVYLDGRLLATAPEPAAVVDGPQPRTAIDSVRAQMRQESEQHRLGGSQMSALALLSTLSANALHGIEVYRSNEVPPPSLGAWFGMTKASIRACGSVAVWTKAGAQSLVTARNINATGRAVQVISGTLIDFDTGKPLVGRSVSLLSERSDPIGSPVVTDSLGDFSLRSGRAGEFRLTAGGNDYLTTTTPSFRVSANEMVVVKLFVSARNGVLAPLGVAARLLPQNIGLASLAGFTYRRERAVGGSFFRGADIERANVRSVSEVVSSVPGLAANCAPTHYIDGARLAANIPATLAALSPSQVFGVEVYVREADFPPVFADGAGCALVVIWTKR